MESLTPQQRYYLKNKDKVIARVYKKRGQPIETQITTIETNIETQSPTIETNIETQSPTIDTTIETQTPPIETNIETQSPTIETQTHPIPYHVIKHQTNKTRIHKQLLRRIYFIKWNWNMDQLLTEYKRIAPLYFADRNTQNLMIN